MYLADTSITTAYEFTVYAALLNSARAPFHNTSLTCVNMIEIKCSCGSLNQLVPYPPDHPSRRGRKISSAAPVPAMPYPQPAPRSSMPPLSICAGVRWFLVIEVTDVSESNRVPP